MITSSEVILGKPLSDPTINGNDAFHAQLANFVQDVNYLESQGPRAGVLRLPGGFMFELEIANIRELAAGEVVDDVHGVHVSLNTPVTGTNKEKVAMTIGGNGTEVIDFDILKALSGSSRPIEKKEPEATETTPRLGEQNYQRAYTLWNNRTSVTIV